MKRILFLFSLILIISFSETTDPSKILIIYFSKTGNTEKFANYITEISNEISAFKIEPATSYPEDYNTMLTIAREEQSSNARPEIKNALNNVNDYEIILLGYPIWYSHLPNIVINQLEKLDLNGKTIYPFNTHGSSGTGSSINDIKNYANKAIVKDGFPISSNEINNKNSSINKIKNWIDKIIAGDSINEEDSENENPDNSIFIKINLYLFYFISILLL